MDISMFDKAEVLHELYLNSFDTGFVRTTDKGLDSPSLMDGITVQYCREHLLETKGDVEYLGGRVIKVNFNDISPDGKLNFERYNRHNGPGKAERVIKNLVARSDQGGCE